MPHTEDQRKPVTLLSATLLVIANMIGTGVFTTLGLQLTSVHSIPAVLLLWIAGGASAFCGAMAYGELGAMMPRSGGEYTYLSNIYHPAAGFLSGCTSIVAGFGAPIALSAIALGHYMQAVFPWVDKTAAGVLRNLGPHTCASGGCKVRLPISKCFHCRQNSAHCRVRCSRFWRRTPATDRSVGRKRG